ncbi:hypothetical protein IKB17_04175 [bacterium]|nr:hypothetical protein [bacterium]
MAKLTVAKINEMARGVAMEEIAKNGLTNFLQIEGTKFAKDFEFETEEGTMVKTVRIDIVVPKLEEGENAEFLAEDYQLRLKEKEENAKIKAEAKAKKIARDQKKRAEKQANESNPIIKRTIKE